jgi:hypothetical protein
MATKETKAKYHTHKDNLLEASNQKVYHQLLINISKALLQGNSLFLAIVLTVQNLKTAMTMKIFSMQATLHLPQCQTSIVESHQLLRATILQKVAPTMLTHVTLQNQYASNQID